jgi:hypothetical protein
LIVFLVTFALGQLPEKSTFETTIAHRPTAMTPAQAETRTIFVNCYDPKTDTVYTDILIL